MVITYIHDPVLESILACIDKSLGLYAGPVTTFVTVKVEDAGNYKNYIRQRYESWGWHVYFYVQFNNSTATDADLHMSFHRTERKASEHSGL